MHKAYFKLALRDKIFKMNVFYASSYSLFSNNIYG